MALQAMEFTQPAELNRYVDSTIPLNWAVRWKAMRLALPILLFSSVVLAELVAFRSWLNDRDLISTLTLVLVGALLPLLLVLVAFEIHTRLNHRVRRSIKLDSKRILVTPAKYNRISWDCIKTWRLEPLVDAPDLSKLTLEYRLGKRSSACREWSMVLHRQEQEHAFLSELEHFRQVGFNTAELVRSAQRPPLKLSPAGMRGLVAMVLGCWLLIHGVPLLAVGLTPPRKPSEQPRRTSRFTEAEIDKLGRTVLKHFSSMEEFQRFLLVAGGGMTGLGLVLYFGGFLLGKKPQAQVQERAVEMTDAFKEEIAAGKADIRQGRDRIRQL